MDIIPLSFTTLHTKGQLISEAIFGVFKSPKKTNEILRISALASKSAWSNQESISVINSIKLVKLGFLKLGQTYKNIFLRFLLQMKTS